MDADSDGVANQQGACPNTPGRTSGEFTRLRHFPVAPAGTSGHTARGFQKPRVLSTTISAPARMRMVYRPASASTSIASVRLTTNEFFLESIALHKPRILILEYNAVIGALRKISFPYDAGVVRTKNASVHPVLLRLVGRAHAPRGQKALYPGGYQSKRRQ